jgi:hypothetical protein
VPTEDFVDAASRLMPELPELTELVVNSILPVFGLAGSEDLSELPPHLLSPAAVAAATDLQRDMNASASEPDTTRQVFRHLRPILANASWDLTSQSAERAELDAARDLVGQMLNAVGPKLGWQPVRGLEIACQAVAWVAAWRPPPIPKRVPHPR